MKPLKYIDVSRFNDKPAPRLTAEEVCLAVVVVFGWAVLIIWGL